MAKKTSGQKAAITRRKNLKLEEKNARLIKKLLMEVVRSEGWRGTVQHLAMMVHAEREELTDLIEANEEDRECLREEDQENGKLSRKDREEMHRLERELDQQRRREAALGSFWMVLKEACEASYGDRKLLVKE